jgi:hypothetical protein
MGPFYSVHDSAQFSAHNSAASHTAGTPPSAQGLLALWEAASVATPPGRGAALLAAAGAAPPQSLGQGHAQLLALHAHLFGPAVDLISPCPSCGHTAQFGVDVQALAQQITPSTEAAGADAGADALADTFCDTPAQGLLALQTHGHTLQFRLPTPADIAAAAVQTTGDEAFARQLVARCVAGCQNAQGPVPVAELPAPVLDALSQRMATLDPGADVSFALTCPQCATPFSAALDAADLLWRHLQATAERVLLEVDALARTYGWSEPEVLALSPRRRAAYLQMATA